MVVVATAAVTSAAAAAEVFAAVGSTAGLYLLTIAGTWHLQCWGAAYS